MREISSKHHLFGRMAKIVLIIALSVLGGCDSSPSFSPGKKQHGVISPTLSPDNSTIVFAMNDEPGIFDIAFYEMATKKITRINPTGQSCGAPVFSPDGQMLAFASGKGDDRNIFVMNVDGSNLRQLTHSYNDKTVQSNGNPIMRINGVPSFSPDSKRIIFLRSGVKRQRSMGGTMISHWDFYEVEVATGRERRLTNFKYYMAEEPYYLPDGQSFIFSASGPKGRDLPIEMLPKNENEIFIQDAKQTYPHLAFEHQTYAVRPTVSADGAIAFVSRINEFDDMGGEYLYDLFLRKSEETIRLTTERFAIIAEPFLSRDGSLIVMLASKKREQGPTLWLVKTDGSGVIYSGRPWNQE